MTQKTDPTEERLVLRFDPADKQRLKTVTDYLGQTMTIFVKRSTMRDVEAIEAEMAAQTKAEAA